MGFRCAHINLQSLEGPAETKYDGQQGERAIIPSHTKGQIPPLVRKLGAKTAD